MLVVKRTIYYEVGNVCYLLFAGERVRIISTVGSRLRVVTPHGHDILIEVDRDEEWASIE